MPRDLFVSEAVEVGNERCPGRIVCYRVVLDGDRIMQAAAGEKVERSIEQSLERGEACLAGEIAKADRKIRSAIDRRKTGILDGGTDQPARIAHRPPEREGGREVARAAVTERIRLGPQDIYRVQALESRAAVGIMRLRIGNRYIKFPRHRQRECRMVHPARKPVGFWPIGRLFYRQPEIFEEGEIDLRRLERGDAGTLTAIGHDRLADPGMRVIDIGRIEVAFPVVPTTGIVIVLKRRRSAVDRNHVGTNPGPGLAVCEGCKTFPRPNTVP